MHVFLSGSFDNVSLRCVSKHWTRRFLAFDFLVVLADHRMERLEAPLVQFLNASPHLPRLTKHFTMWNCFLGTFGSSHSETLCPGIRCQLLLVRSFLAAALHLSRASFDTITLRGMEYSETRNAVMLNRFCCMHV